MKYAIHAYEDIYSGLHGMYNDFVIEVNDEKEAIAQAELASLDIMESYSSIMNILKENASENCDNPDDLEEFYEMLDGAMEDNIAYEYRRVYDDAPDDIDTGYEGFVEKYGIPYSYDEDIQYILES